MLFYILVICKPLISIIISIDTIWLIFTIILFIGVIDYEPLKLSIAQITHIYFFISV